MTKSEKSHKGALGVHSRTGLALVDESSPAVLPALHEARTRPVAPTPRSLASLRSDGTPHRHRRSVAVQPAGGGDGSFHRRGAGGRAGADASLKPTNGVFAPDGYTLAGDLPTDTQCRLIRFLAEKSLEERRDSKKGSSMLRLLAAAVGSHRAAVKGLKSFSVKTWAAQVLAASAYHMRVDPYEFAHISAQSVYDSTDQFPQADSHARGRLCVRRTGPASWNFDDYQQSKTEGPRDGKAVLVWSDRPAGFRLRKPGAPGGGGANTLPMRDAVRELISSGELPEDAENLLGTTTDAPSTSPAGLSSSTRPSRTRKSGRRGRTEDADSPYVRGQAMEVSSNNFVRRSSRPRKKIEYNVDHDSDLEEDHAVDDTEPERDSLHRRAAAFMGGGAGSAAPAQGRVSGRATRRIGDRNPDTSADSGTAATSAGTTSASMDAPPPPLVLRRDKSIDYMDSRSRPDLIDRLLGYNTPQWNSMGLGGSSVMVTTPTAAEDSLSTVQSLTLRDLPRNSDNSNPFSPGVARVAVDGCGGRCCTSSERLPLSAVPPTPALFRERSMELEPSVTQSDAMEVSSLFAHPAIETAAIETGPTAMETSHPAPFHTVDDSTQPLAPPVKVEKNVRHHRFAEERRNPALAMDRRRKEEPSGAVSPSSVASKASSAMSFTNSRERHLQSKRLKLMTDAPPPAMGVSDVTSADDARETDMDVLGPRTVLW